MTEHSKDSVLKMLEDGFSKGADVDEHNKKHADKHQPGQHLDEKHHEDDDESHLDVD